MNDQTLFTSATPQLAAINIANAVEFYQQRLSFIKVFQVNDYAGVKRGSVEIHLWQCNDKYIAENTACRVNVKHIEPLYKEYKASQVIHPNSILETKPWGTKEFTILDLDKNAITFVEF